MAGATISTRRKNISLDFIKNAAKCIPGATGQFISEVMPTSYSTISGAKSGLQELNSTFSNMSGDILPKVNQIKNQVTFKGITKWFAQKDESFGSFMDIDSQLKFDVATDPTELAEAEISEWGKNANQISKTMLQSSSKLVESQVSATANLVSAVDRQSAVISSGFDKVSTTLNKMLDVLTKNTATLIETTVANNNDNKQPSMNDMLISGGRFNFDIYKKLVKENMENSEAAMVKGMLTMAKTMVNFSTPKDLVEMGIGKAVNKISPMLQKNMKVLDNAIGDTIMSSLIRLGEHKSEFGLTGKLARLFGVDSDRKATSTSKSSLELKSMSFNSVANESLVGAIPGYMRHILIALGGPDLTYDFKSRTFKEKSTIKKEFQQQASSYTVGSLDKSSKNIKNILGEDNFTSMLYDLMMNNLGSNNINGNARNTIASFKDKKSARNYIMGTVLSGLDLTDKEIKSAKEFADRLGKISSGTGSHQMMNQVAKNNINRNNGLKKYVSDADLYGMDLSFINDSSELDRAGILASYGKKSRGSSKIKGMHSTSSLSGTNYTNRALYEIYRRLNDGINVFQVGKSKTRNSPFEKYGDDYLSRPLDYRPKQSKSLSISPISQGGGIGIIHDDGSSNLLENQNLEDGSTENLSGGQRFTRWGKQRGGNLARAMFSGSPQDVKDAFGLIVRDVSQVGTGEIKKGLIRVNKSFGNVSGYMKHKLFGTGYSYDSGETDKDGNPIQVHIKDNKGGGVFGVVQDNISSMFKNGKEKSMKWLKDVAGYFDFRSKDGKADPSIENKRKSLIFSSVGAMAGGGILGGPIGLLLGAVAGNALSTSDIGEKLKRVLFGEKDETTGKRNRKGIVTRALDGVIDPLKYQVGKSFNLLGKVMKKNVLGPLSDIGFAVKDRITSAVTKSATSTFGKVFRFMGKTLLLPFKGLTSSAKFPIKLMGSIFRGITGISGSAIGTGLGLTANMIATKEGRKAISERKKKRNAQIDKDYENDYSSYSVYKSALDKRREETWSKVKNSTSEEKMTQDEIAESNKNIEENSAISAEGVSTLARLGSQEGSIFTHDKGLHDRIDSLIDVLGGGKSKGTSKDDKSFVDSIIGATGSMMSTEGVITQEEARLGTGIIDEAAKVNPNKSSVISKFKNLIGIQSKKKEEDPNKKESWFTKLLKTLTENWAGLLAGAVAAFGMFNSNFQSGLKNLLSYIWNGNKGGKDKNSVMNAVTAPFDMRTDHASNYLNPMADIYHVQTDANGNDITNVNATRAKNAPWYHLAAQGVIRGTSSVGYQMDAENHFRLANKASDYGLDRASDKQLSMAADAETKANELSANRFGVGGGTVARGMGRLGVGLVGGQAFGTGAGYLTSKVLQSAGVNEDWADRGGRVVETGATIRGTMAITKSAATEGGTVNKLIQWCIDKSKTLLDMIGEKIASSPKLAPAAEQVTDFIAKVKGLLTEDALKPCINKISQLALKCGVQVGAGVLTAGVANAAMAGAGAIMQGCNTEELFGVSPGQADPLMTTIATALGGIFNLPFVCLIEVVDIVLAPMNDGKGVRQSLAEIIYNTLKGDGGASLSEKQSSLQGDVDSYNQRFGTNLDKSSYNDMVNKGFLDKIWTGGTKMENGHAVFDENGNRVTNGGIKGALDYAGGKISNEYNYVKGTVSNEVDYVGGKVSNEVDYVSNKADELWSGTNEVDENGKEILDEDGKPIKKGGLKDWGKKEIGKITSTIGTIFTGIGAISKDWWSGEYERDENGDPITDEDGNPVRKGGFKDWALKGINSVVTSVTDPIMEMMKGANDWVTNQAIWVSDGVGSAAAWISQEVSSIWQPISDSIGSAVSGASDWITNQAVWVYDKASSASDWISSKISSIWQPIVDSINGAVNGAVEWVTSKTDWGVNGIKDWIAKKANTAWDAVSAPFKYLFNKGKKEQQDQASISNRGQGGGLDEIYNVKINTSGGMGGGLDEKPGDPLSKEFDISSPFGERVHPITGETTFHKGIDMVPSDGTDDAVVGAVYPGKVTAVGYEADGAGNYVFYETPDGTTIKNMHMKDDSIPANITEGAAVNPGDKLGDMGTTGASTGPHLHYQIEQNGEPVDPMPFVAGGQPLSVHGGAGGKNGGNKSAGPLGNLLASLTTAGTAYLNKVSGGLFGNKNAGNNSNSSSSGASFSGLSDGPRQQQVYQYLKQNGYSTAAAAGIMGNISQESGFDPNAVEGNGVGHGLFQWSYGRNDALQEFASENGRPWNDMETQLEFFKKEMNDNASDYSGIMSGQYGSDLMSAAGASPVPGGLEGFKQIDDPDNAARLFEAAYERAGTIEMGNRVQAAEGYASKYAGQGGGLDEMFSTIRDNIGGKIKGALESRIGNTIQDNVINKINPKPTPVNQTQNVIPNNTPSAQQIIPQLTDTTVNTPDMSNNTPSDTDNSPSRMARIEALITQVVIELKNIGSNTGQSSTLLDSLNQKDFVDTGVRESIKQLGKKASQSVPPMPYNQGNVRSINAIIKP